MTTNEKAFVIAIIQEYTKIHRCIDIYEKELDKIAKKLKIIISLLNKI